MKRYLIALGIEVIRPVFGIILFVFWLPWHLWRTRKHR